MARNDDNEAPHDGQVCNASGQLQHTGTVFHQDLQIDLLEEGNVTNVIQPVEQDANAADHHAAIAD